MVDLASFFKRFRGDGSADDSDPSKNILKYCTWIISIVGAYLYAHFRTQDSFGVWGPAVFWTGMLFVLLFGLNWRLFGLRAFWMLAALMVVVHFLILKLSWGLLPTMNGWTIAGILVPEWLIMELPFAWLEKKHLGS